MLHERRRGDLPDAVDGRRTDNPCGRGGALLPEWREHPCDRLWPDRVFRYGRGNRKGRVWYRRSKGRRSSDNGYGSLRDLSVRLLPDAVRATYPGWWGADPPLASRPFPVRQTTQ